MKHLLREGRLFTYSIILSCTYRFFFSMVLGQTGNHYNAQVTNWQSWYHWAKIGLFWYCIGNKWTLVKIHWQETSNHYNTWWTIKSSLQYTTFVTISGVMSLANDGRFWHKNIVLTCNIVEIIFLKPHKPFKAQCTPQMTQNTLILSCSLTLIHLIR